MEFSKHLGKGLWGIADKSLPVVYGIAFVVLVIRVLPEEEFGNFILIQEIFLVLSNLAAAFALHPLLKFTAEARDDYRDIIGSAFVLNVTFIVVSCLLVVLLRVPVAVVLNAPALELLLPSIAGMLVANFVRNFTLVLLQARFLVQRVFWIDAAHFLGAPAFILVFSWAGRFNSAFDLIVVNLLSLSLSSAVGLALSWRLLRFRLRRRAGELRALWDYGKFSVVISANYMVYMKADTFILSAFWGPVPVAVYNSAKVFIRIYDMVAQVAQMFVFPAVSLLSSQGETASLRKILEKAITFTTVALIPVFIALTVFSPAIIRIIYGDRYGDAIPILQLFSLLCFLAPVIAVSSNTLLGLGHARLSFHVSLKVLAGSLVAFFLLIPWLGPTGAALGSLVSFALQAWLFTAASNRYVPLTLRGVAGRGRDIRAFIARVLRRLGRAD